MDYFKDQENPFDLLEGFTTSSKNEDSDHDSDEDDLFLDEEKQPDLNYQELTIIKKDHLSVAKKMKRKSYLATLKILWHLMEQ